MGKRATVATCAAIVALSRMLRPWPILRSAGAIISGDRRDAHRRRRAGAVLLAARRRTPGTALEEPARLEVVDDHVRRRRGREHGRPAKGPGIGEERRRHAEVVPREHDVLAEALAPLRALAVDEAREVEVEALLLAAAAVGEEEPAPAHERDEAEERLPRDPLEPLAEHGPEPVPTDGGLGHGVVDEEQPLALRVPGEQLERRREQAAVAEELEAVQADEPERLVGDDDPGRDVVAGHGE